MTPTLAYTPLDLARRWRMTREAVLQHIRKGVLEADRAGRNYTVRGLVVAAFEAARWPRRPVMVVDASRPRRAPEPIPPARTLPLEALVERWGLPLGVLHRVCQDGWMRMGRDGTVDVATLRDLEQMGMPDIWRRRVGNGLVPTPWVKQETCGVGLGPDDDDL